MTEPEHEEVDHVPVFWGSAPAPLSAQLMFRVGSSDESLVGHGTTHLIEHLALGPIGRQRYAYNGMVDSVTANFLVSGSDIEVVTFLNSVARALADLPFERFQTETSILRAEEARRGGSPVSELLALRFGTRGHGLVAYPEFALRGIEPASVDEWRKRYFTADNAVLWMSGPPPAGLDLSPLMSGERRPPVTPRPLDQPLPAWFPTRANIVAVSMLAPRSAALMLGVSAIADRLRSRLRDADGLSYDVLSVYEPLDPLTAHVTVVADTLVERAEQVREAFSAELARYCLTGPTQAELDGLRDDRQHRETGSPYTPAFQALHRAHGRLLRGRDDLDQMMDEIEAASITSLQSSISEALESAIWLVPARVGMRDRRLVPIEDQSSAGVEGEEFSPAASGADQQRDERLVIGAEGLTRWVAPDRPITVRYADCQAVQAWTDHARTVWGHDGLSVFVHPSLWQDGPRGVTLIDSHLDPSLVVSMDEPSSYTPPDEDGGLEHVFVPKDLPARRRILPWNR